ncbi:CLUMA_CG011920, isoform A [Clunio marinus]|uniref:CLUMA_CG011920, isoform A n=1 Tax=Clunio marinus TaxID=568069 RepID=A0A1J1IGB1_9DIPT|nr:CLUMA_CG011920, isoform A [Clunio marinus]
MDQILVSAAKQLEKQLDSEIERLDNLGADDIEAIRERRLKEMKQRQEKIIKWKQNGHGEYSELVDEKEFFEVSKKSENIVCHFYRDGAERCKIVDKHLRILAAKHIEARFCKVNAEKCPFLTTRLRIKVIPSIALIADNKTKDYIVGFTDLGNCDDFSTDMMEWRIAQSGAIEYNGDLLTPPDVKKRQTYENKNKTIKSSRAYDSDSSDGLDD